MQVTSSRLGGLLSLLDYWLGSCETQKRVRIDCQGNRPSLRIKREAHLNRLNDRNTAQRVKDASITRSPQVRTTLTEATARRDLTALERAASAKTTASAVSTRTSRVEALSTTAAIRPSLDGRWPSASSKATTRSATSYGRVMKASGPR